MARGIGRYYSGEGDRPMMVVAGNGQERRSSESSMVWRGKGAASPNTYRWQKAVAQGGSRGEDQGELRDGAVEKKMTASALCSDWMSTAARTHVGCQGVGRLGREDTARRRRDLAAKEGQQRRFLREGENGGGGGQGTAAAEKDEHGTVSAAAQVGGSAGCWAGLGRRRKRISAQFK
uniref:Uncharacterized protein n=1 Tax=Oryza sativa subsp. japonica TaxID=39947 RepID=Q2QVP9_ORYSJ|nr:hypothetical protein LOC_Os12g12070 [Oryza sativa Japonica Group]